MRKLLNLSIVVFCLLPLSFARGDDYYDLSYARLSYVQGDVFIQRAEDLGYEEGVVNLTLVEGDKLGTKAGRAEIHLGRKNYLRLDNYTHVDIVGLPRPGQNIVKLHVISGSVFLRINFMEREKEVEVHSPDASFYILDTGLYQLKVNESTQTELRVIEGAAEAAGEARSYLVQTDERVLVSNGHFMSEPTQLASRYSDAFSEWNRGRDALHSRAIDRAYLPAELEAYETELAYAGDWVYERPYGYVWVPHVHHTTWRPYYHGRWLWYPIIGWSWISYDPWGWCVSHYGRWHWRLGLGWYWIPRCGWGPAWVHWYHGLHHHGWCPLSYYGYPGVIVNNHYYGNNHYYYNNYPAESRAMTVVRRDELRNSNISRAALNPNEARKLGRVSLSARQPSQQLGVRVAGSKSSAAAKVLSRTNMRSVERNFSAGGISKSEVSRGSIQSRTSSQLKSRSATSSTVRSGAKTFSSRSATSSSGTRSLQKRSLATTSRSRSTLTGVKTYSSRSSSQELRSAQRSSSAVKRSTTRQLTPRTSRTAPKQYRSRNLPSASNSRSSNRSVQKSTTSRSRLSTVRATRQSTSRGSYPSTLNRSSSQSSRSVTTRRSTSQRSMSSSNSSRLRTSRSPSSSRSVRSSSPRISSSRSVRAPSSRSVRSSSSRSVRSPSSRSVRSSSPRTTRSSSSRTVRSSSPRSSRSSKSISVRSRSSTSRRSSSSRSSSVSRSRSTRIKK